jgi:hypothetical protein
VVRGYRNTPGLGGTFAYLTTHRLQPRRLLEIGHAQGGAQWMTVRYDQAHDKAVLDRQFQVADAPGY